MLLLTNLQILNIIILVSFGFTKANLIPTDSLENSLEKPLKSTSASSASSSASSLPYDDISGSDNDKNDDDSHIRLYYKSNSPNQYISQELEHRFSKNSNYPYNQRLNLQPKLSNQFDLNNYYRNYPYNQLPSAQSYFMDNNNKNKHTMLNLHYHGNTVDEQELGPQQTDYQYYPSQPVSPSRKNFLKMLLMNLSPNTSPLYQQPQFNQFLQPQYQPVYNEIPNSDTNGVQYKIVNLKFKLEPQLGRVVGQGYVETENGSGPKRFALPPREVPDLVKKLFSTHQQQQTTFNKNRNVLSLNKRGELDESLKFNDDTMYEKRDAEASNESSEGDEVKMSKSKRVKKTVESIAEDNDDADVKKLRSLKRRDDIDDEYNSLAKNENEMEMKAKRNELSEDDLN